MKVTIISLDNWGFNHFIFEALQKRDVAVNHINFHEFKYEYPSVFHKIMNFGLKTFFNYNLKRVHLNRHILKRLTDLGKQDKILIIKGDNLSIKTLTTIKTNFSDELIAFFNDSFSRYPRMKKVQDVFDTVYSFEPKDAKSFNFNFITNYIYFPLENYHKNRTFNYELFNISSLDKRKITLPLLAHFFQNNDVNFKLIAYSKETEPGKREGIEYINKKMRLEEMSKLVDASKTLLDIQRPRQEGLSFRVFEALGKHKKLISTNTSLKNYDFYNPNNIAIIDLENIHIASDFFKRPYEKVEEQLLKKYHIDSWVAKVFKLNSNV